MHMFSSSPDIRIKIGPTKANIFHDCVVTRAMWLQSLLNRFYGFRMARSLFMAQPEFPNRGENSLCIRRPSPTLIVCWMK